VPAEKDSQNSPNVRPLTFKREARKNQERRKERKKELKEEVGKGWPLKVTNYTTGGEGASTVLKESAGIVKASKERAAQRKLRRG